MCQLGAIKIRKVMLRLYPGSCLPIQAVWTAREALLDRLILGGEGRKEAKKLERKVMKIKIILEGKAACHL